ncbi:aspartate aminotransferase family protein [Hyphomicrobium sp. CS1GBMeth3]|uniref:aspartate aminotransferase family protein n=1 Tax=Hyphomicrobium sp. CS1GBMeth3 TaxID=1892845 RepID=UPI001559B8CB|nr:aspartate aminotransferase family protein [Hyphomicrobium sp. CS1GBMeth3]
MLELNAFDMKSGADSLDPAAAALVRRRRATFGPTSMLFYKRPLHVVRAEGVWLIEADGTRCLDAYNNVPSIGHCHPAVTEAVSRQIGILNVHTRYLHEGVYAYAERLLATMPEEISNIVFTCTGSESADLAIRIARSLTARTGLIATENAYHGNTLAVTQVSPSSATTEPLPPHVVLVPAPDTYRGGTEGLGARFTADVRDAIETLHGRGLAPAALIADTIFSSDGIFPGDPGFLTGAVAAIRDAGGLFIADEVQPGFARTGEATWGFARHGIVPDMAIMGKPMGNGYPMGAVAIRPDLLASFGSRNGYFNTFGGNPVAAAAGLAVLETIANEDLQQNALETGTYLRDSLAAFTKTHPSIGDVRGSGLYIGVEIVSDPDSGAPDQAAAELLVNAMRERNVLIGTAGKFGNVLKIRPPLAFRRKHADIFLEAFAAALA